MRRLHESGLRLRATLVMVIGATLSGCGGGGGPIPNPTPSSLLTVTPSAIDFESVRVGSNSAKTLTMTNSGTGTLTVTEATLSGSRFSLSGLALPVYLSPGQSFTFSVTFAPATSGAASGSVSLVTSPPAPRVAVGLSGAGVTYQLAPAATSLSFGNVAVASTSTKTVSFTNTGTAAVTMSGISVAPAEFSIAGPNVAATLQPGQSSSVAVTFSPTATGAASGTVSISSDASDSPLKVGLEGAGVTYQLGVNPGSLNFGNVTVASAATQSLTLSNTGTASLTLSQASVTGAGFSLGALSLPLTLTPGGSAPLSVTFAPSTPVSATGSVSVVSSATVSLATVALSGVGVTYQLNSSSSSLNFGNVAVSAKNAQTLTLTSTGTGTVTISQATVSGTGFTTTGLILPATLAPGQSVALTVFFAPTQTGSATGAISVVSNASGSPMAISLQATGVTYQLTPSSGSLAFGDLVVGSTSTQTVSLTNSGTASVTISQLTLAGAGFALKAPTLPITLTAGQSTSLTISFSPASPGSASGTVSVISGASDSPLVVAFSGTGQTYQLTASPASISFGDVTVGDRAILPSVLASTGTGEVTIPQVTTAGSGFTVTSPGLPLTLPPGQSTSVSVTFAPTAGGSVTGTLTVTSTATASPLTEAFSGTGTHAVDLSWTASTSSGVTGYNVYRSTSSAGQFSVINTSPVLGTSFEDSNVTAAQTYSYKVTAIGADGVEGGYSDVASATIPSP